MAYKRVKKWSKRVKCLCGCGRYFDQSQNRSTLQIYFDYKVCRYRHLKEMISRGEIQPDEIRVCMNEKCRKEFPVYFVITAQKKMVYCCIDCKVESRKNNNTEKGNWVDLPRRSFKQQQAALNAIPGPTQYELEHCAGPESFRENLI